MFTSCTVSTPEVALNMAVGPQAGPPLLLLHGVCRRWQDFSIVAPFLAHRWQLHALDFRGHGESGRVTSGYAVADYVRDALAVVRGYSQPVVLFGHSLGAMAAAAVAAIEPERVRAIVLEDPPSEGFLRNIDETPYYVQFAAMHKLAGSQESVGAIASQLAAIELPLPDGRRAKLGDLRDATVLRFMARCLQDLDPAVFHPILERQWLAGYDFQETFRKVRCPALLLCADERSGGMLPRGDADQLVSWLADPLRLDFPQTGHLIHWMAPEKTARLVLGFLESL